MRTVIKMEKKKGLEVKIGLREKVEVSKVESMLAVKGPKGETSKDISNPILNTTLSESEIILTTEKASKKERKILHTFQSHIQNMLKGVTEGHKYILKICSSHFPMNVSVSNNKLVIKNFIGEKHPRVLTLKTGVEVKVEGDKIEVESIDKELAGTTASDIEQLTKRSDFDTRIFQDGIYIMNKDGKDIK